MVIAQYGTGSTSVQTSTTYVSCDRWRSYATQNSKYSVQQNAGSVTPPAGFTNYLGATSSSAYSVVSSDYFLLAQNIEGFNVADLDWGTASAKSVTLSFLVYSSLTGTFGGALSNTGSYSYPFTYSIPVANTWTQISVTIVGPTSGWTFSSTTTGIGLQVFFGLGVGSSFSGTAGAWSAANNLSATGAVSVVGTNGATFYITGVQLEVGSSATSFEYRPYGTELQLCQRYYYKTFGQDIAPANFAQYTNGIGVPPVGTAYTTAAIRSQTVFPQPMRATPTITYFNSNVAGSPTADRWFVYIASTATWTNSTSISSGEVSTLYVAPNIGLSGLTIGYSYMVSGFLTASAEL
jgi:hypothetical protein